MLSLFLGCLDFLISWGSNRGLCKECRSVIQRVLDHALNAASFAPQLSDTVDWDFPVPLDFNFDLLEAFDYLRADIQSI
jgi:hypothetical protein